MSTSTNNKLMRRGNRGVTLVEIAIVLVIIGLLLGGVLKGQELINSAKVRSMADRQNSLKVAWFAFVDRYQAIPGDYVSAVGDVPNAVADGDGDGFICDPKFVAIDARLCPTGATPGEAVNVMQHLTGAGLLRCPQCTGVNSSRGPFLLTGNNTLLNQYGGLMGIFHDALHYSYQANPSFAISPRLAVHTGRFIPSNILGELDRKIDDGNANTGDMVFSSWYPDISMPGEVAPQVTECMAKLGNPTDPRDARGGARAIPEPVPYRTPLAQPPVEQNCGASIRI